MHLALVSPPARAFVSPAFGSPPMLEVPELERADVSDAQLVAELIHQGEPARETLARAHALLDEVGGLHGLRRTALSHLRALGLSEASATRLRVALALGSRASEAGAPAAPMDAATVSAIFRPLLAHLPHEEMHLVLLDRRARFLGRRRIGSGGSSAVSLHVRDVLAPVVEARVPAFALVHNHPSGNPKPSRDDLQLSHQVLGASVLLGLWFVDHLVVAEDGYASACTGRPGWPQDRRRS